MSHVSFGNKSLFCIQLRNFLKLNLSTSPGLFLPDLEEPFDLSGHTQLKPILINSRAQFHEKHMATNILSTNVSVLKFALTLRSQATNVAEQGHTTKKLAPTHRQTQPDAREMEQGLIRKNG